VIFFSTEGVPAMPSRIVGIAITAILLLPPSPRLHAEDLIVRDARGLNAILPTAKPGDRILLQPGDYVGNFFFHNIHGTQAKPITLTASDPARPPHLKGRNLCLQFSGASHLIVSDLELSGARGNGLVLDDAEKFDRPATGITLKNLRVHDIGPNGNCDGIKLSGLDGFRIENCTVERWGDGGSAIDMVGCHRGLILDCSFRNGGDNGVQMKGGSTDITLRRCLFQDAGARAINLGGSTEDRFFRPPLKSMPADRRYEAKNLRVEGCTFVGGSAAVAFVGVDGAIVRFNTFYHPERHVMRILQENTEPGFVPSRDGQFLDNIIVFRSDRWSEGGVNLGPDTSPKSFRFARNAWYCDDRPERSAPNLPTPGVDEIVGKDPQFQDASKLDFRLKTSSPAAGRGSTALPVVK